MKRIADALEEILGFNKLNISRSQEAFDFSLGSLFSWSERNNKLQLIPHFFEDDLENLIGIDKAKVELEKKHPPVEISFDKISVIIEGEN